MRRLLTPLLALLALEAAAQESPKELKVGLLSPSGRVRAVSQVTIQFNQPMAALGDQATAATTAELSCAQGGQWRWLDPSTLAYLYDQALPLSTECKIRVPAGVKSLSGAALAQEAVGQFETERPLVVRTEPEAGSSGLDLQPDLTLTFNQKIDSDSLGRIAHIHYQKHDGTPADVPVTVRPLPPPPAGTENPVDPDRSYMLRPVRPLPREASFDLVLEPGLVSKAGPLASDQQMKFNFQTYPFLKVQDVSCSNSCRPDCDPSGGISLSFTTPVLESRVRQMIRFEPPLPASTDAVAEEQSDEPTSYMYLRGPFEPDTNYTLIISPELEDQYGQRLGTQEKHPFQFGHSWPVLDLGGGGFAVFESSGEKRYPLGFRSASDASLRYRLFGKEEIIPFLKGNNLLAGGDNPDLLAGIDAVGEKALGLPEELSRVRWWPLELEQLFGKGVTAGLAYLEATSPSIQQKYTCNPEEPFRVPLALQVNDLGLTAKIGYFKTLVWVTSLTGGTPMADVALEIRDENNKVLWSGKTGADGIAEAPGRKELGVGDEAGWRQFPLLWIFAEHGSELAFLHSNWSDGIEAWNFGLYQDEIRTVANLLVSVLTDRPIYRPGDAVRWKALARSIDQDRLAKPIKGEIWVQIRDSQGEVVKGESVRLNDWNSASGEITLGRHARLGVYGVEAGFSEDNLMPVGSFQVEEYRTPTFKVEVTPVQPSVQPGETAHFNVSGRYLFGAPVVGRSASYSIWTEPSSFQPAPLQGYDTSMTFKLNEDFEMPNGESVASGKAQLDAQGAAAVETKIADGEMLGPVNYELEAVLQDQDSRTVAGRASVLVHPAGIYVGLRPKDWATSVGQSLDIDVLAAGVDGTVAANVPVQLKLYRRVYNVARRKGVGSFYHYDTSIQDTEVTSTSVQSGAAPVTSSFSINDAGLYIVVAEATDAAGHKARASTSFYAWGGALAGWARYDHDRIDLVPDKAEYQVGQTARILVKSPYEKARALITVERDSVMRHFTREVQGSATLVEVPIQDGDAPNVFVSVVLIEGRVSERFSEEGVDLGKPSFKIGYCQLPVRDPAKKLAVEVKPEKAKYEPRQHVRAQIQVKTSAGGGVASELCVIAVDEAVLQLVSQLHYNPFDDFYVSRPLGVRSMDSRIHLIGRRHFGGKGENPGGGGAAPSGVRKNFRTVAFWNAQLLTDAQGNATIDFDLPDNLTTFRIIAIAADQVEKFGTGSSSIVVSQPLVSQPALPRFLVEGDHAELGVVLNNGTGAAGTAQVKLEGSGFTPEAEATRSASISAAQSAEVRFPVLAQAAQELVLRFSSALGSATDSIEVRLPVKDASALDTYATYGTTAEEGSSTVELKVPADIRTDRGGLSISVSATLATALEGAVAWMRGYPYTCLEQQTSRALMAGVRLSLGDRMQSSGFAAETATSMLQDYLANVASYQMWDGGFSYWPLDGVGDQTDPFLTTYVAMAMQALQKMGNPVDEYRLGQAYSYLDTLLRQNQWPVYYSEAHRLETSAFALAVLGEAGKLDEGLLQPAMASQAKLSVFGLANLLDAQLQLGGKGAAYAKLKTQLMNHASITAGKLAFQDVNDNGLEVVLGSPVRSAARTLQVLALAEPTGEQGPSLMRWLMTAQKAGRWENTQDNAFALLAAHDYLKVWEAKTPAFQITAGLVGGAWAPGAASPLGQWSFTAPDQAAGQVEKPASELPAGQSLQLKLDKVGPGRMYYGLRMQVAPKTPQKEAVNSGFSVLRQYAPAEKGALPSTGPFERGKLVKVRLTVTVPAERYFVAIEDPLPAGLEAVNLRLANEARSEAAQAGALEGGENTWNQWYDFVEKRDDRVVLYATFLQPGSYVFEYLARATTVGAFTAAAPKAEEMYSPEVYGRGTPAQVTVSPAKE